MKIITLQIELGIDNMESEIDFSDKEQIANFLNNMLYDDPEFFGEFGPENITNVVDAITDDEAYWKRKAAEHE